MGDSSHRWDGPLSVWQRTVGFLLALALAAGLPAATIPGLVQNIKEQVRLYKRHLPDLNLRDLAVDDLLARAEDVNPSDREAFVKELTKAAINLSRQAKREVLRKIRQVAATVSTSPTEVGNYQYRRQLILTFDKIERAAGRRPLYPRKLGRPFVTLVERPSDREFALVDAYFGHLAKLKDPKTPGRAGGGLGGTGGSGGDPDASDPGGSGGHGTIPFSGGGSDPVETSAGPGYEPPLPGANRGWQLVRYYILAVIGALVLLYFSYLGYSAAKGGKNALGFLIEAMRRRTQVPPDLAEDSFKLGMKYFRSSKFSDAVVVFERLADQASKAAQPARYYLILSALKTQKKGLVVRNLAKLDREKFSPDELYRLANELETSQYKPEALDLFQFLRERDQSFRDVVKRVDKLQRK